jgi:hypothetical protein
MCTAFQELDIRSRAAASIVDDWQYTILPHAESDETRGDKGRKQVKSVWKLDEVIELLVDATKHSAKVPEICNTIKLETSADDGESSAILSQIEAFSGSLRRLNKAINGAISILEMFESQGIKLRRTSAELRECLGEIDNMLAYVENFREALEWEQLERTAVSSDRILAVADYMRSTGQASA